MLVAAECGAADLARANIAGAEMDRSGDKLSRSRFLWDCVVCGRLAVARNGIKDHITSISGNCNLETTII